MPEVPVAHAAHAPAPAGDAGASAPAEHADVSFASPTEEERAIERELSSGTATGARTRFALEVRTRFDKTLNTPLEHGTLELVSPGLVRLRYDVGRQVELDVERTRVRAADGQTAERRVADLALPPADQTAAEHLATLFLRRGLADAFALSRAVEQGRRIVRGRARSQGKKRVSIFHWLDPAGHVTRVDVSAGVGDTALLNYAFMLSPKR